MINARAIVLIIFGVFAARLFGQIYHTRLLCEGYRLQISHCEEQLNKLQSKLALLEEQTLAFESCGEATDYAARYDFGLKKKNETYVILSKQLDQDP